MVKSTSIKSIINAQQTSNHNHNSSSHHSLISNRLQMKAVLLALVLLCLCGLALAEDDDYEAGNLTYPSSSPTVNVTMTPKPKPVPKPKPAPVSPSLPSSNPNGANTFETKLYAEDLVSYSHFGHQLAAAGNMVMVGTSLSDIESSVYLFCQPSNKSDWVLMKKLSSPNYDAYDGFGLTFAMDNGLILIGAKYENSANGQVYAYTYGNSASCECEIDFSALNAQSLFPFDYTVAKTYFGSSLAIHSNLAAVGAPGFSAYDTEAGAVFLYFYSEQEDR
jgi:hypothetical protein